MTEHDAVSDPSPTPAAPAPSPEWTMLVYFAGDNNLTAEMLWGLQELTKASADLAVGDKKINIVAHFDPGGLRSRRYDIATAGVSPAAVPAPDGGLDATAVYTERFVNAKIKGRTELEKLGGPGRTLSAFVLNQVLQSGADAQRYMVVLSGHGSGAEGDFLSDTDPTTSLSIPQLGIILREARRIHFEQFAKTEEKPEFDDRNYRRIDVLGMDSCLMSNVEVCYEIRNSVDYLVASEGFVENTGWPYHRVVEALVDKNASTARGDAEVVTKEIARSYTDFYRDYEISGVSTDIAVGRLRAFRDSGLTDELGKLAKILIPKLEAYHARRCVAVAFGPGDPASTPKYEEAQNRLSDLTREIAETLGSHGTLSTRELHALLENGSEAAKDILKRGALSNPCEKGSESPSVRAALLELKQSLEGNFSREEKDDKEDISALLARRLWKEPTEVSDPAVALALVRAMRELDPGVQEALKVIEKLDEEGSSRAKSAREMLLLFHHLRQTLELAEFTACAGGLTPEDRELWNGLVSARWEAQPFKGGIYVDLYDFCSRIEEKLPGVTNSNGVKNSIPCAGTTGAVIDFRNTGADFQHAHGLSVFFPVTAADYTPKYMNLQFAKDTGWGRLVRAYLEATRRPRRDEDTLWVSNEGIRRYEAPEVDPLRRGEIEARIVGVDENAGASGTEPDLEKGGGSNSAKGGGSNSAKGGGSNSAKGKLASAFGNKPDGFRRIV